MRWLNLENKLKMDDEVKIILKEIKDEASSASVVKEFDEIFEMHLENKENNMKHSLKLKQLLGELE